MRVKRLVSAPKWPISAKWGAVRTGGQFQSLTHSMSSTGPPQYGRAAETNNSVRIGTIKDRKGRR